MWPKLKFYGGLDKEKASDMEIKGAAGKVLVEFQDGRHFEVRFEAIGTVTDWIERQVKKGEVAFNAEPGLIILEKVTLKNMNQVTRQLAEQGEFGFFSHLKEWNEGKEEKYHNKYLQGIEESTYQYPSIME